MKVVLDASVALAGFLPDESAAARAYAHRVLAISRSALAVAVVPPLWHEEVADVLLRTRRAREVSAVQFDEALALLRRLPVETHVDIYAVEILIERALRYHLQAYDAVYFDLAHVLRLPIATLDAGLRTAARAHGVKLFEPAAS